MDLHHDLDNDGQSLPKDNVVLDKVDNRSSNGDNVDNVVDTVAVNIVDNVVEEPSIDEVLARQKKLDKGKGVMTKEDTVKNKKQKSVPRGNGISIRENEGPLSSDSDSDSDELENCVDYGQYSYGQYSSESEGNGEGISDPFVMVEKQDEKYPIHDDQTHWRLKKPVALPNFQIAIVGDVGTAGAKYPIGFDANVGGICFICSDIDKKLLLPPRRALNSQEIDIWETEIRGALKGSDGAIIMFDENSPTYSEVPELIRKICRFCGNIPIVLCRNRVDLRLIVNTMQLPGNIKYCEISAPSNYNIERPFLLLAMMLVSPSISFMEEMAHLVPPQDLPNQQQIAANLRFKIVIMGAARTGKTSFLERHVNGVNQKFVDTITGVTVYPIDLRSNLGLICFNCWDTTRRSQDGVPKCLEIYNWKREISRALKGADGAIIMFDVNEESPYDDIDRLFHAVKRVCPRIPIVLCGNKVDLQNRNVNAELLAGWLNGNTGYCEISARSNYNFERPFFLLARELVSNDEFIWFREPPALVPAEFEIDLEAQARNEEEFFNAVYRAHDRAFRILVLKPFAKRILNKRRNQDPNSPLPDHDDELMWMVEVLMEK